MSGVIMRSAARGAWAMVGIALLSVGAGPAVAGIGAGNGEIGFDFGYTDFDSDVSEDSGGRFAVRGGYHFTRLFQLEGELGSHAASSTVVASPFGTFDVDTTLGVLMANAVFNFHPAPNVVPYVSGGVGFATLEFDVTGLGTEDDNDTAYQVAGGGRFFFGKSKRTAVRLDARYLSEGTFDETSKHTSLSAGFTWRLGPEP